MALLQCWAILAFIGLTFGAQKFEYGQSCTPSENWCNYGKWMWCRSGKCECLHPNRQIYDEGRDRCVGTVGTECNVYIGERDCVSSSICQWKESSGKSTCQCKPGFTPQGGHGRSTCRWEGDGSPPRDTTPKPFDYSQFIIVRQNDIGGIRGEDPYKEERGFLPFFRRMSYFIRRNRI